MIFVILKIWNPIRPKSNQNRYSNVHLFPISGLCNNSNIKNWTESSPNIISELKLINYPNIFKVFISREQESNLIRTKLFRISESNLTQIYKYLNWEKTFNFKNLKKNLTELNKYPNTYPKVQFSNEKKSSRRRYLMSLKIQYSKESHAKENRNI